MEQKAYIIFRAKVHKKSIDSLISVIGDMVSKKIKNVVLIVSSTGGEVQPSLDFYDFAKNLPIDITTYALGQVASAAIVIYCIAPKRSAHSRSKFLIHGIRGGAQGFSIKELEEKIAPSLKEQSGKITDVIAEATKKNKSDIEKDMTGEIVLDVAGAKSYGLITDVINDNPIKEVGFPIITIGDNLFSDK